MDNRSSSAWLIGFAVGTAAMYFFDPDRGTRRRAVLRDQAVRASRKTREGLGGFSRDLGNRVVGAGAEMRGLLETGPVDDRVLQERVRAALGRVCSHPSAITVLTSGGQVTLSGVILAAEHPRVIREVNRVRGVVSINDQLDPHDQPGSIPALQGDANWAYR